METEKKQRELERLAHYLCPTVDARQHAPVGVLLSDEIEHYANSFRMIDPFDRANLKPAGYELTVGNEFVLGGKREVLKKDDDIRIPPFNVVVIKTGETINLPRFLIARWNVRVRWAYEGLLWVGGPQVDPGWIGHLFCPLYNLSNKDVVLRYGDAIALMDFVTTTPFDPAKSMVYPRPPKRVLLEEYRAAELESALYTEAKRRIDEIEAETGARIDTLEKRMDTFLGSILVIITVLFAVLGILTTFGKETLIPVWPIIAISISIVALLVAIFSIRRSKIRS